MLRYRRAICGMLVALMATEDMGRVAMAGGLPLFKRSKPKTCLEQAATEVDRLERELNQTGTVVIKAPDIWGESRLTKHRQEFEREMEKQITQFQLLLNANIRRSDQAYLASALAIQAALPGGTLPAQGGAGQTFVNSLTTGTVVDGNGTKLTDTGNPPIARTNIYTGTTGVHGFAGFVDNSNVGLEPTIRLDEMKRYLDHLNEIRRVNEGDDTSDSPGYSLNLVRIPVSLLPGEMTRAGHGAEVTITAKPHVSPELLPKVYRDLVINDLVDSLGLAMVKLAEYIDSIAMELDACDRPTGIIQLRWKNSNEYIHIRSILGLSPDGVDPGGAYGPGVARAYSPETPGAYSPGFVESYRESLETQALKCKLINNAIARSMPTSGALARNARQPVSQSQAEAVYGAEQLVILAYEFWKSSAPNRRQLTDARAFLKDQLDAGYDYLQQPAHDDKWNMCSNVDIDMNGDGVIDDCIHKAVRTDDREAIDRLQAKVGQIYKYREGREWKAVPGAYSPVTSAAWLVLVEAALLNSQLNDDLQRVSQDPNCGCQCQGMQFEFFRPTPTEDAKQAFVNYVNCRWPVHVFALDPVVQQQNIADQYSMRREMQLALALAFASGRIGAQSMTRYARRLEIDMETIALNRTDVAFGHGTDTFGWRFTPRVQTPPFDSNLTVICRDLIRGGPNRDDLRKTWELEAGQRECTAIVLMPSFIDHMTFESRGNYFKMTDCHLDLTNRHDLTAKVAQDVRWSQQMQGLHCLLDQIACEQANFLPGESERVRNRVEQLSRRIPLQTVHARVPNENTIGGFEMFSSGVTDLAPELIGYYGEPGVNPKQETIVYLVGKKFSVHDTHVLAGNHDCEFSLISRQVMQVRIPSGVRAEARMRVGTKCTDKIVDVHVATPYGVSSHLEIPILEEKEQPVRSQEWGRTELAMRLVYTPTTTGDTVTYDITSANTFTRRPHELPISVPPFGVTVATIPTVNYDILWDEGGGLRKLGASHTISNVPFVNDREQYLVGGQNYRGLIQDIATSVKTDVLTALYSKKGSTPPTQLDLTISGEIAGKPIGGELHVSVLLEQAK